MLKVQDLIACRVPIGPQLPCKQLNLGQSPPCCRAAAVRLLDAVELPIGRTIGDGGSDGGGGGGGGGDSGGGGGGGASSGQPRRAWRVACLLRLRLRLRLLLRLLLCPRACPGAQRRHCIEWRLG